MTMVIGPDFLALQVRDLRASSDYYTAVFGFEAEAKSPPGAVLFKTKPITLALRTPLRPLPEADLGIGMSLWIACEDASSLHDLIVAKGGVIVSPPSDGPFGRFFVARDPDGYGITFHTART